MHIGLLDLADPLWTGGQNFTKLLATVLSGRVGNTVTLLSSRDGERDLPSINLEHLKRNAGRIEGTLRSLFSKPQRSPLEIAIRGEGIDVILPALDLKGEMPCGVIGWIPDFQHKLSAQFFTDQEIQRRDAQTQRIARFSDVVLFSSEDARRTFASLFPAHSAKGVTIPFPSTLALSPLPAECPEDVRTIYHLPEKFLFVPNQFWRHKNHQVVVSALAILRDQGLTIHCVLTGLPHDSRDPQNGYLSEILQAVNCRNLRSSFSILGFVPKDHLISLLRMATLIVQPSLSEGWSTSVQDARAIGRPLICSDLPVHREQAPDALAFFSAMDAGQLAEQLAKHWATLKPGPDGAAEQASLCHERTFVQSYTRSMSDLAHRAGMGYQSRRKPV